MRGWVQAALPRVILVEGYVAGILSTELGHGVGFDYWGYMFRLRFGNTLSATDVLEATRLVLGRVGQVWQVWYIFLPKQEVIHARPRIFGAEGFPSWH